MSPSVIKASVSRIKGVAEELTTLQSLLQTELDRDDLRVDRREAVERLFAGSGLTYQLRLFTAFEAGLHDLGPHLPRPYVFPSSAGLAEKLNKVGLEMRMPQAFRDTMDRDVRTLRNELQHGRSLNPRLDFETVYDLMRQFYRGCH